MQRKMNGYYKLGILLLYVSTFLIILHFVNSEPVHTYVQAIKNQSLVVHLPEDDIARQIKEIANKLDQPAIDAKIDPIWKAIPGYDGVRVNQDKSYQLSKKMGQVGIETLVIEQVKPKKQLEDLPLNPIYRGNPEKPMISLMVNVAWGTEYVKEMLEIFDKYQVKSTFFLDGMWLHQNKELALEILKKGHEIGNHAYSHPNLSSKSNEQIYNELAKTENLIEKLGTKSKLFAPPSGDYDERVVSIANKLGMKVVLWTLDTVDWKKPPASTIVERIVPRLENGALILMHPTKPTVEALPRIIEGALRKELQFGTTSDLLSSDRVQSIVRID